jgi:hypothetical protein
VFGEGAPSPQREGEAAQFSEPHTIDSTMFVILPEKWGDTRNNWQIHEFFTNLPSFHEAAVRARRRSRSGRRRYRPVLRGLVRLVRWHEPTWPLHYYSLHVSPSGLHRGGRKGR